MRWLWAFSFAINVGVGVLNAMLGHATGAALNAGCAALMAALLFIDSFPRQRRQP